MHPIIETLSSFKDNEQVSEKTRTKINQLIDAYGNQEELIEAEVSTCQKVIDKAQSDIQNSEAEKKRVELEEEERVRQETEKQEREKAEAEETERQRQETERVQAEQQQQMEQMKNVVWPHEVLVKKNLQLLTREIKGKIQGFTALKGKFMKNPSDSTKKAAMKVSEGIVAEINAMHQKKKTIAEEEKKRTEARRKDDELKKQKQEKEQQEKLAAEETERKRLEAEEAERQRLLREEQDRNGEFENPLVKGFLGY